MNHDEQTHHNEDAKQSPAPTKADHFDLDRIGEQFTEAIREGTYPNIDVYLEMYPENVDEISPWPESTRRTAPPPWRTRRAPRARKIPRVA